MSRWMTGKEFVMDKVWNNKRHLNSGEYSGATGSMRAPGAGPGTPSWRKERVVQMVFIALLGLVGIWIVHRQTSGPTVPPAQVDYILGEAQNQLRGTAGIAAAASAFDGVKHIAFRLMVKGLPSRQHAVQLFSDIVATFRGDAHGSNLWGYYDAHFDIKSYTGGVVYTANIAAGGPMVVNQVVGGRAVMIKKVALTSNP